MKDLILDVSRQNTIGKLDPWFEKLIEHFLGDKTIADEESVEKARVKIIRDLVIYREQSGVDKCVLGMSGGVDSALTAALFKEAGWNVTGFLLPINQNPEETARGAEACEALDIAYEHIDLSHEANAMADKLVPLEFGKPETKAELIRIGNIRARLRMITLYNEASMLGGLVASTDNFSELTAGFWTLHGDVGDLSPIQSLWKSYEVPLMAKYSGVPKSIWAAKPTDGLGIDNGDEDQFGCSYLEWDLIMMCLMQQVDVPLNGRPNEVWEIVTTRLRNSGFKRYNPAYLEAFKNRFSRLEELDNAWKPSVLKGF